jgi:hypothetical protein
LKPDEVAVREFKILDGHGKPLTIGGRWPVHEFAVGAVNIDVQSQDFEAINSRFGKVDTWTHS